MPNRIAKLYVGEVSNASADVLEGKNHPLVLFRVSSPQQNKDRNFELAQRVVDSWNACRGFKSPDKDIHKLKRDLKKLEDTK